MDTVNITVSQDSQEIASGTLEVDVSARPQTATFTPEGGSAVTCQSVSWSKNPNGATNFSFKLTATNGDFPVPPNTPFQVYSFTGQENGQGKDPSGNVNWPQDDPSIEGDQTATWQGEATVDEPYAQGQGAS